MRISICFGGSTFNPENISVETVRKISEALKELHGDHEILVTTGGGQTARKYIKVGKELGIPHKKLDQIGIQATRLNAKLLISAIGEIAEEEPPESFEKAIQSILRNKIPVMGGTQPGHTTDAVAAELANTSDSDLLIYFTDVDGIYTEDPHENEDAEKIHEIEDKELSKLMSQMDFEPGLTAVIDPLAAEILSQAKIRTLVLGAEEIENLREVIEDNEHQGTEIVPTE